MIQPRVKYEPAAGAATTMLNVQFLSKLVLNVNFVWTQCRGLPAYKSAREREPPIVLNLNGSPFAGSRAHLYAACRGGGYR